MAAGAPCGAPAGGSGLRAPPQADMAGLELASHRLGGAQRHQAGLLDGPAPATEVQGEAGRGGLAGAERHQDHHAADGAAEGSGGHGMDGEEHRLPTPHRSGRARAPQALASALARAEVDGAVLVWCSLLPWLRPVADSVVRVWWCSWGSSTPQRPMNVRRRLERQLPTCATSQTFSMNIDATVLKMGDWPPGAGLQGQAPNHPMLCA